MSQYYDSVIIGALASGFAWRWIFFIADDIREWWRKEGCAQWERRK